MIQFAYPYALFLLILPFFIRMLLPAVKGLHGDALHIPFIQDLQNIVTKSSGTNTLPTNNTSHLSFSALLLWMIWLLLTLAVSRPQFAGEPINIRTENHDILLVVDISTSMLEPDFALAGRRINRLTAVKKTALEFMDKRLDDRIGLILFGTNAYLQAPLTYDRKSVGEILLSADAGMAGQSTAIGDSLGLALKTLKNTPNLDRKIIILLTDGENNDGSLSLPQAIKLAQDEGVKIYTIGVGAEQAFHASFFGIQIGKSSPLDEKSLQEIANATQGQYFRAKDTTSLEKIYEIIDKLEPTSNESQTVQEVTELYYCPLILAVILALLGGFIAGIRKHG